MNPGWAHFKIHLYTLSSSWRRKIFDKLSQPNFFEQVLFKYLVIVDFHWKKVCEWNQNLITSIAQWSDVINELEENQLLMLSSSLIKLSCNCVNL